MITTRSNYRARTNLQYFFPGLWRIKKVLLNILPPLPTNKLLNNLHNNRSNTKWRRPKTSPEMLANRNSPTIFFPDRMENQLFDYPEVPSTLLPLPGRTHAGNHW